MQTKAINYIKRTRPFGVFCMAFILGTTLTACAAPRHHGQPVASGYVVKQSPVYVTPPPARPNSVKPPPQMKPNNIQGPNKAAVNQPGKGVQVKPNMPQGPNKPMANKPQPQMNNGNQPGKGAQMKPDMPPGPNKVAGNKPFERQR